ncbi:hypothetical protein Emed_004660 [Eimeria media]
MELPRMQALDPEGLFGSFVHPGPTPSGSNTATATAGGRSPATMQLQAGGLTGPFLLPEGWGFTGTLLAPRRPRQEGPLLQQQKQLQQQQQQQLQQQKQLQQRQMQRHQQIQQFALLAANRLNFPVACSHPQQVLQPKPKNQQPMQQQQQQQHMLLQHKIRVQQHMQMRQQQQLQQQQLQQQKIQQHQAQQQQLEQRQLHQQQVGQQQLQQKQQQQQTSQQQQRSQQQQQILQQQQRLQQQPQQACKQRPTQQQQQQQQQKSQLMQQQYPRQRTIDQQQQQQQPVDQQQMLLLQGRETGVERTDLPQSERTCARLSRVPTNQEETLPYQQQQQQQLGTDVDYSGPSAIPRPQQQQQQNEEKQREEAQQKQQQQQQQDSPLQRLQEHLDRHLQELQQQQQQQEVLSEASGVEQPSVSCAKEQSILRRRSKCSNSSTATSPRSRSSSSSSCNSSTSSCSSRTPPASAESTLIIIDYDDTLLPTNWVAVQHRVGLGDPVPAALQRELQQLTACIHETVSLCLSAGKVVLVTNASLEWVSRSGEKYIPGVWQLLLQQQIEIISARDRLQHHGIPQRLWKTHVFSEIVGDTLGPLAAAGEPCCLISIGDGEGEREACMQLCRSLPGKGWLFKSLKLLMQPSCSQLTSQHLLLQQAFNDILLVQQSLDMAILDYQLAALEETRGLKALEATESGGAPTSEDEVSVGGPHEGPLGTGPLPVLLAQEQGQRQQLLQQQQQQQQQQAALAKQTAFVLKNQGSVLGSTTKEKGLLRGPSCSYRAAATTAAAKVPGYPLLNAADQHDLCCSEETAEETPQQLQQSLPTSAGEAAAAATAAEAAAANTDAFIDLISAQLASQHLGLPSPPTKGPLDPLTCRRAGRGPQEGAPTTKLLSALEQN